MTPLSGADLLRLWEAGQDQRPLERALALLRAAGLDAPARRNGIGDPAASGSGGEGGGAGAPVFAGARPEELDVAMRDARLFRLRAALFGPTLAGVDACPHCGADTEFLLDTAPLAALDPPAGPFRATEAGIDLRFRLPTTGDIAAVLALGDAGPRALARRCILVAERAGEPLDPQLLPDALLDAIERRMAEVSPTAEVRLRLTCADCGDAWERALDIGEFLWDEIATEARRLTGEVHVLARAYGWGEAEILGMSARRRRLYLELV